MAVNRELANNYNQKVLKLCAEQEKIAESKERNLRMKNYEAAKEDERKIKELEIECHKAVLLSTLYEYGRVRDDEFDGVRELLPDGKHYQLKLDDGRVFEYDDSGLPFRVK